MRFLLLAFLLAVELYAADPKLDEFFDRFSAEWVRANPSLATSSQYFSGPEQDRLDRILTPNTAEWRRAMVDRAKRGLTELRRFDRKQFSASQRISARVMEWQLDRIVRGEEFEQVGYVFSQMRGEPGNVIRFMTDVHPIRNPRDAENYLARLSQVSEQLDEAIAEAQRRVAKGIIPPRFILSATLDQTQRLAVSPEQNVLITTLMQRMDGVPALTADKKAEVRGVALKIVTESVNAALHRVITLLKQQQEKATDDAGLWKLPNGIAAYQERLRQFTTTNLTPDQIHNTGLEQVARIKNQMDTVLKQMGYTQGTVEDRFKKASDDHSYPNIPDVRTTILADYTKMMRDAEQRADTLFDIRPKAPVVVRRIPEFSERNAAANYLFPAPDGSRPGTFNVPLVGPTFSKLGMRTLAYHEAVPGHHFQVALQREDDKLPRFRRDGLLGGFSAFSEGWGLYAEALAIENGWYEGDLPGKLGALDGSLFRARRLVVDTGLHTKRWTRQQGIDYGIKVSEVERYVVMPGQACSYMIGQLKILELRDKARRELGEKFAIKEFHNVVLRTGSVPMDVLAEVVDEYIASKK